MILTPSKKHNKHKKLISTGIFILVLTMLLFSFTGDPDFGWHYKFGEYIVTHKALLFENIFSYTYPDYLWVNSYWFSQIIIYILYKNFGPIGLSLTLSLIFALYSYKIFSKAKVSGIIKIPGLFIFTLIIGRYLISVRPFYFSSVFMLALMYVLLYEKKYIRFLPILFVFWVNMHADFLLGIFVLGIYTLSEILKAAATLWSKKPDLKENARVLAGRKVFPLLKSWLKISVYPILSLAATLLNPYGMKIWTTMFNEIGNSTQFSHISEWIPFGFELDSYSSVSFFAVTSFMLGLLIFSAFMVRKKYGWWFFIVNLVLLILSIRAKYFMRIFLIMGIFGILDFWGSLFEEAISKIKKSAPCNKLSPIKTKQHLIEPFFKLKPLLITILYFAAAESFVRNITLTKDVSIWAEKEKYPYEAVSYIKKTRPEGNMFNEYDWGGYLIWQLPEYKTFIDGRMASWHQNGEGALKTYVQITKKPGEYYHLFEEYVNKYDINFVLLKKDSDLVKFIKENHSDRWQVVLENEISTLFTKLP